MQGWLIAVIVLAGVIFLAAIVLCCVCCCRSRRLKQELHVYNHTVDAQGRPLLIGGPPINNGGAQTATYYNGQPNHLN